MSRHVMEVKTGKFVGIKKHPLSDRGSEEKLLDYLLARVRPAHQNLPIARYSSIDREVAGYVTMSQTDKERMKARIKDGEAVATNVNLPITAVQIDDIMTYFVETFAPNHGMFYIYGDPSDNTASADMVTIMNSHASEAGYFSHLAHSLFCALKYNLGGMSLYWGTKTGFTLEYEDGVSVSKPANVWSGNTWRSFDMYNTFYDTNVHPTKLHSDGEWVAYAEPVSYFTVASKASRAEWYNCQEFLDGYSYGEKRTCMFYRDPGVDIIKQTEANSINCDDSQTNWHQWVSDSTRAGSSGDAELLTMYIKLLPEQFNLVSKKDANGIQLWKFVILNGTRIIEAEMQDNFHGHLPAYFTGCYDDQYGAIHKSVAETLSPLQMFASFLVNTHISASRRNIFGATYYDEDAVKIGDLGPGESVSAFIPVKRNGKGENISNFVYKDNTKVDTSSTMDDLSSVMQIMEQFFPSMRAAYEIGSIDRAIDSQVSAVQHGANRRLHKMAKLIDYNMLTPMRVAMYYNILQYYNTTDSVMDFRGRPRKIDLTSLRQTDLPYILGMGLKSLDRASAAATMQKLVFAVVQSPISQQIDVMALFNSWAQMLDINLDLGQFSLSPEQIAAKAAAGSATTEIDPMVNPDAVTVPLTKTGLDASVGAGVSNA